VVTAGRCTIALLRLVELLGIVLAIAGIAIAQEASPVGTASPSHAKSGCPQAYSGANDKPGPDVINALTAQSSMEDLLDTYHVKGRVLAVAIDLSKPVATIDLVADNSGDVAFIRSSVPITFEGVSTEVTESKPYDRFLPYMLSMRGLSKAPDPKLPAGCPAIEDSDSRPDLDVVRAMAARIDLEAEEPKWFPSGDTAVIEGIGIDLEGPVSSLDVTVDDGTDKGVNELACVKGLVPKSFEGVPVEVSVVDVVDLTGSGAGYGPPATK
jgi:hypothetical protein